MQEGDASPERARGTAKRWRGAPPAPTSPHSTTYPHTAKPPGTNPWGPCVLRGIFLNQIRGRLLSGGNSCSGNCGNSVRHGEGHSLSYLRASCKVQSTDSSGASLNSHNSLVVSSNSSSRSDSNSHASASLYVASNRRDCNREGCSAIRTGSSHGIGR